MAIPAIIQQSLTRPVPALAPLALRGAISRGAEGGPAYSRADEVAGAVDRLVARFPVIRRLVGDDSFRVMARRYILSELARGSLRIDYGDAFPRFLRRQGNAASVEYVADIAELEMVHGKASRSPDALPVTSQAFSALRSERLAELHLVLHPSVFLVASRFPIVTIWENNRRNGETGMIERWRAESALVARPFLEVEVRRLPPGGHAFISAISRSQSLSAAAAAGVAAAPDFDITCNLALVNEAKIVIGIREQTRMNISSKQRRIAS